MGRVARLVLGVALINAAAFGEGLEIVFFCTFVYRKVALCALQVPCRLPEVVFICHLWVLALVLQQLLDSTGSGDLVSNGFVGSQVGLWCLMCQKVTVRCSMTSTVSPWCTLVWHVWHWKPLLYAAPTGVCPASMGACIG